MAILIPGGGALSNPQSIASYSGGTKTGTEHYAVVNVDSAGAEKTKWDVSGVSEMSFMVITPISAFAASKFHLVLYNANATSIIKVHRVVIQPTIAAVTGVLSGYWNFRRRVSPTTAPAGAGSITPVPFDTADTLPASITAFNAPGTAPAGGTVHDFGYVVPQPDEIKLTTQDAPTMQSTEEGGGLTVFDSRLGGDTVKPIMLRQNQGLELAQDATAGTGNARIFAIFTVA